MDLERVVEVWVPATRRVGSGYLLTDRLVLTAHHVVRGIPAGEPVEVRPLAGKGRAAGSWIAAEVCWPAQPVDIDRFPERDAALLQIVDTRWNQGAMPGLLRFGVVAERDRVRCEGVGFPQAEARPDGIRDTLPVVGTIDRRHGYKSTLLNVLIDQGMVPAPIKGRSGWSGASGAALFCGPLLIGVVATDRPVAVDDRVLGAVPVQALAELEGFAGTLADHGLDLSLESAPVSEYEPLLGPYLAAVVHATEKHPYPAVLNPSRRLPPLAAVYLPQQLRGLPSAPGEPIGHDSAPGRPEDLLTAGEVLAHTGTVVVTAEAGGGKSTLLRNWAADLARQHLSSFSGQVPVLVRASALIMDPDRPQPLAVALAAAASADLAPWLEEPLPAEFFRARPAHQARWLVLVDALDEITAEHSRRRLLEILAAQNPTRYQIVIAIRPAPESELAVLGPTATRYTLLPFTSADLRTVATKWFTALDLDAPRAAAEDFLRAVGRARLQGLVRSPLMAAMLCQLYARNPQGPLPEGRTALYARFIELVDEYREAPGHGGLRAQTTALMTPHGPIAITAAHRVLSNLSELLKHLAAARYAGDTTPALDLVAAHAKARPPDGMLPNAWRAFLDSCLRRSGLLTSQAADFVFLHQTLLEYLAARDAIRDRRSGRRALRRVLHHPTAAWRSLDESGARPRVWCWTPPHNADSYVGFLLDIARDADPSAGSRYLERLASRRAVLASSHFIATQAQLGTLLPQSIIHAAAEILHGYATTHTHDSYPEWSQRLDALRGLHKLGDPRGCELLYGTATDITSRGFHRLKAAEVLAELGDPRGLEVLRAISADPVIAQQGIKAFTNLTARSPVDVDVWHALATNPGVGDTHRRYAAEVMTKIGDARGPVLLHALATAPNISSYERMWAARRLADLGDTRGPELLYALATDPRTARACRVSAAQMLLDFDDPRAPDLLFALATDPELHESGTLGAFILAGLGDPRAPDLLYAVGTTSPDGGTRVQAAGRLADLGDPRGRGLLHDLAAGPSVESHDRLRAAKKLCGLEDFRGADLLHDLASDPRLSRDVRVRAVRKLSELGDSRSSRWTSRITWLLMFSRLRRREGRSHEHDQFDE
jgi:HEAT repeat protein